MDIKDLKNIDSMRDFIKKNATSGFLSDILALEYDEGLISNWLKKNRFSHKYNVLKSLYSKDGTDTDNLLAILSILDFSKEDMISFFEITDFEYLKEFNKIVPIGCNNISVVKSFYNKSNDSEKYGNLNKFGFCVICGMSFHENDKYCTWCGNIKKQ